MANETNFKQSDTENSQERVIPAYDIQPEQFKALADELSITQPVLQTFFTLVTEKQIPPDQLTASLQQIAGSYAQNLKELAEFDTADPEIKALWEQAKQALEQGDFNQAEELLKQASQAELVASAIQPQTASQRKFAAAEATAQNARLHLTQFNDVKAAGYFHKAAKILPQEFEGKLADYFIELGGALYRAGRYTEAEPFLQKSLDTREKSHGASHPAVLAALNLLAKLYLAQGKQVQAGRVEQKILAIKNPSTGADTPVPSENSSAEFLQQTDCPAQEAELQAPQSSEASATENQQQASPDFQGQDLAAEATSPVNESEAVNKVQNQHEKAESFSFKHVEVLIASREQTDAAPAAHEDTEEATPLAAQNPQQSGDDLFAHIVYDFEHADGQEAFEEDERGNPENVRLAIIAPWVFGILLLLLYMEVLTVLPGELPAFRHQLLSLFSSLLACLFAFTFIGSLSFIAGLKRIIKFSVQSAAGIIALVLNFYWWQNPDSAPLKIQAEVAPVQVTAVAKPAAEAETKAKEVVASPKPFTEDTTITKAVLMSFLKQLRQQAIPSEQYDSSLHQIARRYHKDLKDLNAFNTKNDDVKSVLVQARQTLEDGEFDDAEQLINKAGALDLLAKDPNPQKTGQAKSHDIEQAEAELAEKEKTLGKEHPDIAVSLSNLATLYEAKGAVEQAQALYERSLAIREKALGKDHPDVAISLNNLALLYKNQGKYAQAEPLYQRSLAINEKALGKNHPNVAASLDNQANLLDVQDKFEQAEPLHQRSMKIYEKVYGPEHPEVATSLNNLALLYYAQGKYTEAEPLYKKSLAIREKALGTEHPDVANSLNNLAFLYQSQAQYEQAEPLYKRAIAIVEKALGKDNAKTKLYQENYESLLAAKKVAGE